MRRAIPLRRLEDGVTLAELLAVVAILIVLVAIAIPTFGGVSNQAKDSEAKAELREALAPVKAVIIENPSTPDIVASVLEIAPGTAIDPGARTGARIDRSTDGAVCLWRISATDTVFGIWEPPFDVSSPTLFAVPASIPATCPTTADAPGAGFAAGAW